MDKPLTLMVLTLIVPAVVIPIVLAFGDGSDAVPACIVLTLFPLSVCFGWYRVEVNKNKER